MRFGSCGRWNASLEVMASSMPGIGGIDGRAPVAISTLSTENGLSRSASLIVCASSSSARVWARSAPAFCRLVT